MYGVNKQILLGTLGSDIKIKTITNGGTLGVLSVFVKEGWTSKLGEKQERLQIFQCNLWGSRALALEKILTKGSKVYIEGKNVIRDSKSDEGSSYQVVDVDVIQVTHYKENGVYKENLHDSNT